MSLVLCWRCRGAGAKPRRWCVRCGGAGRIRDLEAGDHVVFVGARNKTGPGGPVRWEVEARTGGFGWAKDAVVRSLVSGKRRTVDPSRLVAVKTAEERLAEELMR